MNLEKKTKKEIEIEMQIILNKNLYEKSIINENMYNYVANKLNKQLSLEKDRKEKKTKDFIFVVPLLREKLKS
ncbi:MAG TPA: hypothetical protein PLT65_00645 [Bacilli bacterium]|nr:hypothetical protein [Bacilli bacterium]